MKKFSTSNSGHSYLKRVLAALLFLGVGSVHAQDRLVVKGFFTSQISDARVHALLIASDGTQMPIHLSRNGKYTVNAPAAERTSALFAPGCVTKEVRVNGDHANKKEFGERTIKFDMVLHAEHPIVTMHYTGPVAEISFEEGTGAMKVLEQYQLVPFSSFTAQEF